MSKICICARFGGKKEILDGQIVKSKNLYNQMKKDGYKVSKIDTYSPVKRILLILFQCIIKAATCKNIVILPAHNGVKLFAPLFSVLASVFRNKIHYAVVGGWLPEYLNENKWLIKYIKKIDYIYVETKTMKHKLDEMGFSNVSVMYNFKDIYPLDEKELINDHAEPFRFCTFSRVSKEKGIEDAISAVKSLNDEYGKIVATLDIYGRINSDYVEKFEQIKKTLPDYIKYKGVVSSEMSIEAIKGYYMLMFPTYYEGEGFAGTLIDAFSSGLPVIATDWRYNGEIVEDGVTGLVYSYKEKALLKEKIKFACENPSVIQKMRPDCLKESRKYLPEIAIQPLYDNI